MYSVNFEKAFKNLILIEQGYSNHPLDPGGKTKYGITENVAEEYGITSVKSLTLDQAKKIYYEKFWKPYNFSYIKNSKIASELFDFTVNTGRGRTAVKILQRSFNVLNKKYLLKEDGILGPETAEKVNSYKFYKSLFKVMNIFQALFYIGLAEDDNTLKDNILHHQTTEGNKVYKTFVRGWIDKRVVI